MLMSSPSLKVDGRTSNNAESTISNRRTNRSLKSATRHFPELGILPDVMEARGNVLVAGAGTGNEGSDGVRCAFEPNGMGIAAGDAGTETGWVEDHSGDLFTARQITGDCNVHREAIEYPRRAIPAL